MSVLSIRDIIIIIISSYEDVPRAMRGQPKLIETKWPEMW